MPAAALVHPHPDDSNVGAQELHMLVPIGKLQFTARRHIRGIAAIQSQKVTPEGAVFDLDVLHSEVGALGPQRRQDQLQGLAAHSLVLVEDVLRVVQVGLLFQQIQQVFHQLRLPIDFLLTQNTI